ncbi:MAG: arylsulfatase, partial [Planctomycetales bacterium]|nr:arylsulfatase [Planctomycetales bacterium]
MPSGAWRSLSRSTAALCAALCLAFCAAAGAAERRPNIVLFLADDLGYAELGSYGQKIIETPHLDALAKQGVRFTQFYSGCPVCAPARCMLMTGKHSGHAYIRDNGDPKGLDDLRKKYGWEFPGQNPIPAEETTVAELLHAQGYATAAIGKWGLGHFGTTGDPLTQGFDLFYGFNCQRHAHNHYPRFLWRNRTKEELPGNDRTLTGKTYSQDKFIETGLAFIREHQDQPFFLYMPFAVPHLSIQVPDALLAQYDGKIEEADYVHRGYLQHPRPRAGYAAMISHMDRGVGQILALLDELKLADDTIVLFSSDNGPTYDRLGGSDSEYFHSAGPFRGLKGSIYEGGIRVPLIVRWPGKIKPGRTSERMGAFWDLLPTLCELTGTPAPNDIDGVSFAGELLGRPQPPRDFLYW